MAEFSGHPSGVCQVAKLGLAGVLSIAVAETVFWVLSFPVSAVVYYGATGEWIDLMTQDGQAHATRDIRHSGHSWHSL